MTATDDRAAYLAFKERVDSAGEADKDLAAHEYATAYAVWFPLLRYIAALETEATATSLRLDYWRALESGWRTHADYRSATGSAERDERIAKMRESTKAVKEAREALKDAGVDP